MADELKHHTREDWMAVATERGNQLDALRAEVERLKLQLRPRTQFCQGCEDLAREVERLKVALKDAGNLVVKYIEEENEALRAARAEVERLKAPLTDEERNSLRKMMPAVLYHMHDDVLVEIDAAIREVRSK